MNQAESLFQQARTAAQSGDFEIARQLRQEARNILMQASSAINAGTNKKVGGLLSFAFIKTWKGVLIGGSLLALVTLFLFFGRKSKQSTNLGAYQNT